MNLRSQKRMAAELLKCGQNKVVFDPEKLEDISEAITREDIRILIKKSAIKKKQKTGISRGRIRKAKGQKKKGRGRGHGKRSGGKKARDPKKKKWTQKVRALRNELRKIKAEGLLDATTYRRLYRQASGNLFHGRRHLREHIERLKK